MTRTFSLLLLVVGLTSMSCGGGSEATQASSKQPTAVRIERAVSGTSGESVSVSGRLASASEATLSFKIGGVIDRITARPGQLIRKGELLASLKLAEIDNLVSQARSGFEKAERDLRRAEKLYADSVASLTQLQDARTGYETALAALEVARFNQQYASITAPFDGRLLGQFAEEGELVEIGQRIVSVGSNTSGWIARIGLVDRDRVRLAIGDSAVIRLDALPDRQFHGVITELAGAPDQTTGTYRCEVRIVDPSASFVSGLVANLSIATRFAGSGIRLPLAALVAANGNRADLFIADAALQTAHRRAVTFSLTGDEQAMITSGLAAGEQVVVEGAAYLVDGGPISAGDSGSNR